VIRKNSVIDGSVKKLVDHYREFLNTKDKSNEGDMIKICLSYADVNEDP